MGTIEMCTMFSSQSVRKCKRKVAIEMFMWILSHDITSTLKQVPSLVQLPQNVKLKKKKGKEKKK